MTLTNLVCNQTTYTYHAIVLKGQVNEPFVTKRFYTFQMFIFFLRNMFE